MLKFINHVPFFEFILIKDDVVDHNANGPCMPSVRLKTANAIPEYDFNRIPVNDPLLILKVYI